MTTEENVIYLSRYRKHLLIFSLLVFTISAAVLLFLYIKEDKYSSEIKFFIPDKISYEEGTSQAQPGGLGQKERLEIIAHSKPLLNAIIDSFNLVKYYNIDPKDQDARLAAASRLREGYKFLMNPQKEITITVRDRDRHMAFHLAKAFMKKLSDMNNQFLTEYKLSHMNLLDKRICFLQDQRRLTLREVESLPSMPLNNEQLEFVSNIDLGASKDISNRLLVKNNNELISLSETRNKITIVQDIEKSISELRKEKYSNLLDVQMIRKQRPEITGETIPEKSVVPYLMQLFQALKITFATLLIAVICLLLKASFGKYASLFFGSR